jgi:aspartyl-tRNA(Asn)/glutamyl-tRNA(Gln) amidotransferase subunit A
VTSTSASSLSTTNLTPNLTVVQLAEQLQTGAITAEALTEQTLQRIETEDKAINAFISLTQEQALNTAKQVDADRKAGKALSPWAGIPMAIKDNMNLVGSITTCGSHMLHNYVSPYNATAVERLLAAGIPLVGKANMDEFAMGSSNETSAYGPVKNPVNPEYVPGGSSGGSAAAVAAGWVPWSLGSDTGGSVRQPAALCGLYGLKPTYGLVSRYGLVAYASSLDQISPFGRSVADVAAAMDLIAGYDPNDMTSLDVERTALYTELMKQPKVSLKVGVITDLMGEGLQAEVREAMHKAVQQLEGLGASVQEVSITGIQQAIAAYYVLAPAECSSNLARFDGVRYGLSERQGNESGETSLKSLYRNTRAKGFGWEVKRRIMMGTFALSAGYYDAYYGKAQKARYVLQQAFKAAFNQVDVLLCPTTPTTAFKFGEKTDDPITMYLSDVMTIPANLAGIPALSLPYGQDGKGLPIGLQLMGPRLSEGLLLATAEQLV